MSRLVILPIEVNGTTLKVPWYDQWDIDTKTGEWYPGAKNFIDGEYTITAKHSGLVLTASSNSSDIQQQQYTGASNQLWQIENRGASHFRITSVATGKCFDVSDESREAGAKVIQYDWKDSYNQKWHIIDCGNGYHRFVAVNTLGKSLEIENSSKSTGARTVIGDFSYKDHQLFKISSLKKDISSNKKYLIVNKGTNKVIEATENSNIFLGNTTKSSKQVWTFTDMYNSYFTITNLAYGTAIDNINSFTNSAIYHKESKGNFTQQWQLVSVGSGYYKIINRKSGKLLYAKNDSIIQSDDNTSNNENQQWKFEEVDKVKSVSPPSLITHNNLSSLTFSEIYTIKGELLRKAKREPLTKLNLKKSNISMGIYIVKDSEKKIFLKKIYHIN